MLEPTALLLGLEGLGFSSGVQIADRARVVEVLTRDPGASACPDEICAAVALRPVLLPPKSRAAAGHVLVIFPNGPEIPIVVHFRSKGSLQLPGHWTQYVLSSFDSAWFRYRGYRSNCRSTGSCMDQSDSL